VETGGASGLAPSSDAQPSTTMSSVHPTDLTNFFHAVIAHLAMKPNGVGHASQLGQDPAIKATWAALNLAKSRKMANILDTRPDLFSRLVTDKAQPVIKLEALAFQCLPPNPIPALDPVWAAAARGAGTPMPFLQSLGLTSLGHGISHQRALAPAAPFVASEGPAHGSESQEATAVGLPPMGQTMSTPEAKSCFLMNVMLALATKTAGTCELAQIGATPQVQQAWKAGGLDRKYKMVEVLRERCDLIVVGTDRKGSTILTLTQLGAETTSTGEIPPPDMSVCPMPPPEPQQRNSSDQSSNKGKGKAKVSGQTPPTSTTPFMTSEMKGTIRGFQPPVWSYGGRGHGTTTTLRKDSQNDGPDLPRERFTETPLNGEVLEWRGRFGWLKPLSSIEHPAAEMHHSRVYVNEKDLVGAKELEPGQLVSFHVYADESGIGAEKCTITAPAPTAVPGVLDVQMNPTAPMVPEATTALAQAEVIDDIDSPVPTAPSVPPAMPSLGATSVLPSSIENPTTSPAETEVPHVMTQPAAPPAPLTASWAPPGVDFNPTCNDHELLPASQLETPPSTGLAPEVMPSMDLVDPPEAASVPAPLGT